MVTIQIAIFVNTIKALTYFGCILKMGVQTERGAMKRKESRKEMK